MDNPSTLLLVIGCQRSGTSLLASMLGGHPEINMLYESTSTEVTKLLGKKYQGNKLLAWRQIRMHERANKLGYLVNRLVNRDFSFSEQPFHTKRPRPISVWSIQDYIDRNAKIIGISRTKNEVIKSMMTRTEMTEDEAEKEYLKSNEVMNEAMPYLKLIDFSDLVNRPEETMVTLCDYLGLDYDERMLEGARYNFMYPNTKIEPNKSDQA